MCDARLPGWFVYVGYAGVFFYTAGCVFVCLVMGLKFDRDQEDAQAEGTASSADNKIFGMQVSVSGLWIISSILSMLQDVIVNQPAGVLLSTVFSVFVGTDLLADLLTCYMC